MSRRRFARLRLDSLESRLNPAIATLLSGVLTIDNTAMGFVPEAVTLTNDGTNIVLTGDVTGNTSIPVARVNKIVITDSGGSNNQSLTVAGTKAYTLSGGFSSLGVETVSVITAVNVAGKSALSITAPKTINVTADLSTVDGALTLLANQQTTQTSGNFIGINVNNSTISSTGGNVMLQGRGGDNGNGNYGVRIQNGGKVGWVAGSSPGSVTVQGTGGLSSGGSNYGVWLSGSGSQIASGGGDVKVVGTGGGTDDSAHNFGVCIDLSPQN